MASSIDFEGQWFCVAGSWVFPKDRLKKIAALPDEYDKQPRWHLRQIKAGSKDEARRIVAEFLEAVSIASLRFCWPKALGRDEAVSKRHAWKHVDFRGLEQVAALAIRPLFANQLSDSLSPTEATELCRKATDLDPRAIARLTYLFPEEPDRVREAKAYLGDLYPTTGIPSAYELADKYMHIIYGNPASDEANAARDNLAHLTSIKSLRGQMPGQGDSREEVDASAMQFLHEMASAILLQLREVDRFLSGLNFSDENRQRLLMDSYPWLAEIRDEEVQGWALNLLQMKPTEAGFLICEIVLKLSPSKIEKTVYPKHS